MNPGIAPPRRVLFVDHTAKMGGGEFALLNLVKNLTRSRYEPVVVLFSDGPLAAKLKEAGIETHLLPLSGDVLQTRKDSLGLKTLLRVRDALSTLGHVRRLARFMKAHRIELVHTNSLKADVIGGLAARLARKPLVWHIRDRIDRDYLPVPVVHAFRGLCRVVPDRVIANSAATLETLHLNRAGRTEAIHSGIDLGQRTQVVHDGMGWMTETGVGARKAPGRRIGLVGRISPWKGQDIFLRAAAQVHRRFPDVRFQIIGSALFQEQEYEQRIRRLCTSLGLDDVVEFTGFRDKVSEAIEDLEILIHASTTGEPFGQVVIEGMAAAKPVVATAGGGVPEIVVDGVTGLLVPMGEVQPMARAISHLLESPELGRQMGVLGQQRVWEMFTIAHTSGKVERLYDELLQPSTSTGMSNGEPVGPAEQPGDRARMPTSFGVSLLCCGAATALTLVLRAVLHEHAPISAPFLAVVAISAGLYGRAAGLFATAISAGAMAYLIFPPERSFRIEAADRPAFFVFVVVALLLTHLFGMLKAAKLREELARRRAQQAQGDLDFIAKVGAALAVPTGAPDVLRTISYLATSRLCDRCMIDLVGTDGTIRRAWTGLLDSREDDRTVRTASESAVVAIRTGRPYLGDADECSRGEHADTGATPPDPPPAMMVLPLVAKNRAIGALTLVRDGSCRSFSSADLKLASAFALRAAYSLASLPHQMTDAPSGDSPNPPTKPEAAVVHA